MQRNIILFLTFAELDAESFGYLLALAYTSVTYYPQGRDRDTLRGAEAHASLWLRTVKACICECLHLRMLAFSNACICA